MYFSYIDSLICCYKIDFTQLISRSVHRTYIIEVTSCRITIKVLIMYNYSLGVNYYILRTYFKSLTIVHTLAIQVISLIIALYLVGRHSKKLITIVYFMIKAQNLVYVLKKSL